ncbi:MAG: hypothetical protein M3M95_03805 [Pseudomonadota bacterium]|nr:hypothetical protein [Pseudomonadota bacterium]
MASKTVLTAVFAASVLVLSACERGGAEGEAARAENASPVVPSPDAEDLGAQADRGANARASAEDRGGDREDPRAGPQPTHENGAPLWAANRDSSAEAAAQRQFERNGEAFGADTVEEYIDRAHAFVSKPPAGAERATRASNGDKLVYDPKTNTFAVATRDGAPRTMFKPDEGAEYWERQKQQASRRRASNRDDQG